MGELDQLLKELKEADRTSMAEEEGKKVCCIAVVVVDARVFYYLFLKISLILPKLINKQSKQTNKNYLNRDQVKQQKLLDKKNQLPLPREV